MGPDFPSASRVAIARVVKNLKAEHDLKVNKPESGQHVKVGGRRCKLLEWCSQHAVVVNIDGESSGAEARPFVVHQGSVDCT